MSRVNADEESIYVHLYIYVFIYMYIYILFSSPTLNNY